MADEKKFKLEGEFEASALSACCVQILDGEGSNKIEITDRGINLVHGVNEVAISTVVPDGSAQQNLTLNAGKDLTLVASGDTIIKGSSISIDSDVNNNKNVCINDTEIPAGAILATQSWVNSQDYTTNEDLFAEGTGIIPTITSAITAVNNKIDDLNIENGEGTNSIQQKQSSKDQEFDNALYDITSVIENPAAGATGKDSFEANGNSIAHGELSSAFGRGTVAIGARSHTEGTKTITTNSNAHAEGSGTLASGLNSHAEGYLTKASGIDSHAEGCGAIINGVATPTEAGDYSHAEGVITKATNFSHTEGDSTKADNYSHAEGYLSSANDFGHAEGIATKSGKSTGIGWVELLTSASATKTISLSEGQELSVVSAICDKGSISTSISGGTITATISGTIPSAENVVLIRVVYAINGSQPTPPTPTPPVQDKFNLATHTEGYMTEALSNAAHAEGSQTHALGHASHAEGENTIAFGQASHAGGIGTEARYPAQNVIGKYNNNKQTTLFEVGNGTSSAHSNAFEVYTDGHAELAAVGNTEQSVVTKLYVDGNLSRKAAVDNPVIQNGLKLRNAGSTKDILAIDANKRTFVLGNITDTKYGVDPNSTELFAFGFDVYAKGTDSAVFGQRTTAKYERQFVVGRNNDNKSDTIFEVGNGSWNTPSNAFEVCTDGTVVIPNGTKGIKIGDTVLTEADLNKLLNLLKAMETEETE